MSTVGRRGSVRIDGGSHIRTDGAFPGFFDTDQDQFTWQNDVAALGGQWVAGTSVT